MVDFARLRNPTLLIDGDILAYEVAAAGQRSFKWSNGIESTVETLTLDDAKNRVLNTVSVLRDTLSASRSIVCMSDDGENWRKKVLPTYKSNRKDTIRPALLYPLKEWMAAGGAGEAKHKPTLEADDVMGILSTHPTMIPGRKIIVSIDKDMRTVPGWLYRPGKSDCPEYITKADARKFHLMQTLTGDAVDGYSGCPGVGPAKAAGYLVRPDWESVVRAYAERGLTERDALVQARVARICQFTDYDYKKKEVILWTPPKAKPPDKSPGRLL